MKDQELRTKLKKIAASNPLEVIPILNQIFSKEEPILSEIILLQSQLELADEQYRKGLIDIQESNKVSDRVKYAFFQLIGKIEKEDAEAYIKTQQKYDKILVVCLDEQREIAIRKLFPTTYWPGLEIKTSTELLDETYVNNFKIVVFDNNLKPSPDYVDDLIKAYLDQRKPYLLYFGAEPKRFLGDELYAEKAYFANSVFSIQTRLYEMIEYIDNITSSSIEQELKNA